MHLRRAMLLFALVLGLSAMAAAVTRPRHVSHPRPRPAPPSVPARVAPPPVHVRFSDRGRPRRRSIEAGRRAIVTISVRRPGQVDVAGLGLTASAEPLTPARLDVLAPKRGRFSVLYTPAGELAARRLGALVVSTRSSDSR
jgi:hypothetical protein